MRLRPLTIGAAAMAAALGFCRCHSGALDAVEGGSASRGLRFIEAPGSPIAVGARTGAIRVADVNGDTLEDLVVTSEIEEGEGRGPHGGCVNVLMGDGRGGFRAPAPQLAAGMSGIQAAAGDLDSDGRCDLVVGAHDTYAVSLWFQDEQGRFPEQGKRSFAVREGKRPHTHSLIVADLNDDGRLDVATTNADDDTISVLLGDGAGSLGTPPGSPYSAGRHPYDGMSVADVDGDGRVDLVVPNLHGRAVSVMLGDGRGAFRLAAGSPIPVGERPGFVALGELNGDGRPDIVVTHDDEPIVWMLHNIGNGRFEPAPGTPIALKEPVWGAAISDLNADGRGEVLLGPRGEYVLLLVADGRGTFSAEPVRVPVGGRGPGNVAVADLDRDGKKDFVTGNEASGSVSVLLQR